MAIISVKNLGKKYDIRHSAGGYVTLRDVLANVARHPIQFTKQKTKQAAGLVKKEEYWALKDINFEVEQGEVIGIIGANGAGKSTLLKILSQITPPTTGEIRINGRVASLLEVGTGFHPELTGRENIFLNGAILGMTRTEISRKFDDIVEFAGIEKFLDTPVRFYSSGMYVRLAFSVAAHLEPDILIIDEVLAVGDAEFQKKCLGKMDEITKKEGRTILFVSHNMDAVESLCQRILLLSKGELKKSGSSKDIIDYYLHNDKPLTKKHLWSSDNAPGNEFFRLEKVSFENCRDPKLTTASVNDEIEIQFNFKYLHDPIKFNISLGVFSQTGVHVFQVVSPVKEIAKGSYQAKLKVLSHFLNNGVYSVNILFVRNSSQVLAEIKDIISFEVTDDVGQREWNGKWPGVVRPSFLSLDFRQSQLEI